MNINKPIRIVCYGLAKKGSGSGVGSQFLLLEELLQRGFEIDFYSRRDFIYPQELLKYSNFTYFAAKRSYQSYLVKSSIKKMPESIQKLLMPWANNLAFFRHPDNKILKKVILANHKVKQYDLFLGLERFSPFKVQDIPIITWLPSPPQTERYYNHQLKKTIISLCGIKLYFQLMLLYFIKKRWSRLEILNSDILICGSEWSKEKIISCGINSQKIFCLPYAVDISLFDYQKQSNIRKLDSNSEKVFLWLGRCDPRKRLDLLLDAYALVVKERQDVQLKVFAGFPYAKGYKKLIDCFEFPDRLQYRPYIDRLKVPELMSSCDVLIQPSEGENFGSSVAEALSCGLPVIVGPTNGTKDYISSSSFVFDEYTPESLKETMLKAIDAVEQRRKELALDARQTAEQNFDVSKIVDRLEIIFQKTLALKQI